MARTSKSRGGNGFNLKSGNAGSFKMMGSSSPVLGRKDDKDKLASANTTRNSVTADMTDQELRALQQSQTDSKANKFNLTFNELKKLRNIQKSETKNIKQEIKNEEEEVVAPATLQESRDLVFKAPGEKGDLFNKEVTPEREKVINESARTGEMRDLRAAVENKYGMKYHEITDPTDKQMAGDAMIDKDGEILPMSSASGQYSNKVSALPKKASRGFIMKRNRK